MHDKLEKFIRDNRELFDDKTPDKSVWSKIEKEIDGDHKKKHIDFTFVWKAAAVFFFGVSAYLLFQLNNSRDNADLYPELSTTDIIEEFKETEAFYIAQISEKRASIEAIDHIKPDLATSFQQDIHKLDSMYNELKKELDRDSNEQVINALVQNLQIRIEILNQQLDILRSLKKSENDEKVNI